MVSINHPIMKKMGKKKIFILAMLRNMINLGWNSMDLKIPRAEYHRMASIGRV